MSPSRTKKVLLQPKRQLSQNLPYIYYQLLSDSGIKIEFIQLVIINYLEHLSMAIIFCLLYRYHAKTPAQQLTAALVRYQVRTVGPTSTRYGLT
jgi:hypothetical protein